jgi:hypothetical protein
VKTLFDRASKPVVLHLYNHNVLKLSNLIDILNDCGMNISIASKSKFENEIMLVALDENRQGILAGIVQDMGSENSFSYSAKMKTDNKKTQKYLKSLNFEWPVINEEYIRLIVDYMKDTGFLTDTLYEKV